MDKAKRKEKNKLRDKSKKVAELCLESKFQDCLDFISNIPGTPLRNLKIYEAAIQCNMLTERYTDALKLINSPEDHGHMRTSFSFFTLYTEAFCHFRLLKYTTAYDMFNKLLDRKDIDAEIHRCCTDCKEKIRELVPEIEESANQLGDQLIREFEAQHSSPSTSNVDPPPLVPPVVVDPTPELVADPPPELVADPPPELVAESSSVASSSTPSLVFSENMSFEIVDELGKRCYACLMKNVRLQHFQKTLIKQEMQTKRKCLDESTSEDPFKMKGAPFLLKSEFLVYSSSLSCNLYVVEPVIPIQVFFDRKLNDFNGDNEEQWWEFISKWFQTIFRGILCGLFAIHSAKMTCGDLDSSMYVTNDGQGRIFYVGGESFSKFQVQRDFNDLLFTMETIVTLFNPRPRREKEAWLEEFEDSYKLPSELCHFFVSLRYEKVANHMIPTTWLIDHPFFWPFEYKLHFIRILNDVFRQGLIDENTFTNYFSEHSEIKGWKSMISNDNLLKAIYAFKGNDPNGDPYASGSETQIIHFILAVLNHANDHTYNRHQTKLTPVDIAQRITSAFPAIYTILYDVMCSYANGLNDKRAFKKLDLLWEALERCSSL